MFVGDFTKKHKAKNAIPRIFKILFLQFYRNMLRLNIIKKTPAGDKKAIKT
jgi:hypothetical protein